MSAAAPPPRIFIAYRRDDSQGFARSIHDRLAQHFGPDAVFRDINDIEPGMPWEEAIDAALASCDVFVLLIGHQWLEASDEEGNRRIDDPEDRHRREIETAIGRRIRMFVALMEDAHMPRRRQLPPGAVGHEAEGLQKVPALHALRIADHAFDYGIGELVRSIERATERARTDEEARRHTEATERELEAEAERERASQARARQEAERQREEADRRRAEADRDRTDERRERQERQKPLGRGDEVRKRRLRTLAAVGLGAAAVVVIVLLIVTGGGDGDDAAAEEVGVVEDVGEKPIELADAEDEGIWVTDRTGNAVSVIEVTADSQRLDVTGPVGTAPEGIAVGDGSVWVTNSGDDDVLQIDPVERTDVDEIPVGSQPTGIAISEGAVWVANSGEGTVSRIDESGDKAIPVEDEPYGVAAGAGAVWVTNRESGSVSRIDPDADEADPAIDVGENPKGIDVSDDAAWVANTDDGTVTRLDTEEPADAEEFPVGNEPRGVVIAFDSVWVTLGEDDQVARLDPGTGDVEQRIPVGRSPEGITAGSDSIWVANGEDGTVSRIKP